MKTPLDNIRGTNPEKAIKSFKAPSFGSTKEEAALQYDVKKHLIFDEVYRPNKIIDKDTGNTNSKGEVITQKAEVPVDRIGLPLQNQIVEQRIGFMLSLPIRNNMLVVGEENKKAQELIDLTEAILVKNRMYFRNKEILRRQMSEMECAELWYLAENKTGTTMHTMKCKILSPELGDKLYPLFDGFGDMIAFGRGYITKDMFDKPVDNFDIYTADINYKYNKKSGGEWALTSLKTPEGKKIKNPSVNPVGKIMVIYHPQKDTEWANVQSMIQRLEDSVSNHGDMNDYFGSPILAIAGKIHGYTEKTQGGKMIQLERDAKANFLALTTPPDSIKMEQANLRESIFSLSQTADISFDKVKGIGNLSAIALELLFISSSMAAKSKEETFVVGLQRRINLIMATIGTVIQTNLNDSVNKVTINPEIIPYMPVDKEALVEMLADAYDKGAISVEFLVNTNPFVSDKAKEIELLKAQIAKGEEIEIKNKLITKPKNEA